MGNEGEGENEHGKSKLKWGMEKRGCRNDKLTGNGEEGMQKWQTEMGDGEVVVQVRQTEMGNGERGMQE